MGFYQILQQLQTINTLAARRNRQGSKGLNFEDSWQSLYATILQDLTQEEIAFEKDKVEPWLQQIKDNLYNIHKLQDKLTDSNCSNVVELFLLPIFQLAHLYEQNGDPQDHAKRLGTIFSTSEDALNYLYIFAKQNKRQTSVSDNMQLVHEACLFTLPQEFDFKKNERIKKLIRDHMQDPEFRSLLPNLPEIEKLAPTPKGRKHLANNKTLLAEKIANIKAIIKTYKEIKDKLNREMSVTQAEENTYNKYGNELLQAQLDLVKTSFELGRTFDELDIYELKAYNAQYKSQTQLELKYFLDHELTTKNYEDFLHLTRVDDDTRIPPVVINGTEIGYPGYYLRRLNVTTSADAAMAACLGKLSDCCQSLSGEAGEPCARHGLTSPDGGFYVVCKGDINNPSINDELICQSWVWRSESGALVIDSIEAKKEQQENHLEEHAEDHEELLEENLQNDDSIEDDGFFDADLEERDELANFATIKIAKAFYYELAYKLLQKYNIPKISCGNTSGISKDVLGNSFIASYELPTDYNEYRDSHNQVMMCDNYSLYLLPDKEEFFFENCKAMNIPAESPIFIKMICFAIEYNREDLLEKYCNLFNINNQGEEIVKKCKTFRTTEDIKKVLRALMQDPYLLNVTGENGLNILHYLAVTNLDLFKKVLSLYKTKKDILITAITETNPDGNSLLHIVAAKPELLKQLLAIFPNPKDALKAIKQLNTNKESVLYAAKSNDESLEKLFAFYPPEERLNAIGAKGHVATGLLYFGILDITLLKTILSSLPEKDRLKAIMLPMIGHTNGIDKLSSHIVPENPQSFNSAQQILMLFSEKDRLKIITTTNTKGEAILDNLYLLDVNSLKIILELIPKENRAQIITHRNKENRSILEQLVVSPPHLFKQILDLLPEHERPNIEYQYNSQNKQKSIVFSNQHHNSTTNGTQQHSEISKKSSR